jgi:hypothetical protein
MRKIITSAGLIALSAAGAQAVALSDSGAGKFWDVSLTVRGFYDDNYNTGQNGTPAKRSTYGIETEPTVGVHFTGQQTSFGAHYDMDMRYYADADRNGADDADYSHEFNMWLTHQFSERYSMDAAETFTIAQDPTLLDPTGSVTTRLNGNNIHNDANTDVHAQLTRLVELVLGYDNQYYNYQDPLYAGLLNRMEQTVKADLGWQIQPQTTLWIGYSFGWGCYDGEPLLSSESPNVYYLNPINGHILSNNVRNYYSHYVYVGLDHNFSTQLSLHLRAGGQITDYYNNPGGDMTTIDPYVDAGLRYIYMSGCSAEIGFKQIHNATDQFSVDTHGNVTTDTESSIVYANIVHAITPKFIATLTGQYQYASMDGGTIDSDSQNIYALGLDLAYHFTSYLSADVGYNYDRTDSSSALNYTYDRNRVFLGMTASY